MLNVVPTKGLEELTDAPAGRGVEAQLELPRARDRGRGRGLGGAERTAEGRAEIDHEPADVRRGGG